MAWVGPHAFRVGKRVVGGGSSDTIVEIQVGWGCGVWLRSRAMLTCEALGSIPSSHPSDPNSRWELMQGYRGGDDNWSDS
jgi:hypothetical protein